MEITAALEALRSLTPDAPDGMEVVSDSTYVVKCFTDGWWRGWQRRGWKNSQNKPVANRDLWEPLMELALASEAGGQLALGEGSLGRPLERQGRRVGHPGGRSGERNERLSSGRQPDSG